jgi:cytosine/adenosine deaminase-related metal-dependent hydrolase
MSDAVKGGAMRISISGRFIIGFADGDHFVYENGEVVYENDRIVFVGHGYAGHADTAIDYGDAIISPGFIDLDALADIDHAILDCWGAPDRLRGMRWSEDYFRSGRRDVFSREDQAQNRRYALAQLLLNGITTALPIAAETYKAWAETYDEFADIVAIGDELGIRLYLGPSYRSGVNVTRADGTPDVMWDEPLGEEGLRQAIAFVRAFDGANGGLARGMLAPARIETVTLDLLRASKRASDELGCPIRLHAAQSRTEIAFLDRWYGKTPIELLHEIGFLGPRTLIPHAIYLRGRHGLPPGDNDEVRLLAESGTSVIYCPLANARYGGQLESYDEYRAAGVNIAMGTDTFPPDMIQALALGHYLAKAVAEDAAAADFADLYRALTLGGAAALGRDDLGRLAPGAKADITVVDLSALRTGPIADPIRSLVMNCTGSCVRDVIVDGRHVVRDRAIPGLDGEALRGWAQAYFDRYQSAFSAWDYRRRPTEELFPVSFPTVAQPRT